MRAQLDVAHAGDLGGDAVLVGDRAGDDVDLVHVRHRDDHRGVPDAGLLERAGGRPVGLDGGQPQPLLHPTGHLRAALDHHDVVRLVGEPLGDVVADLARADDDDPHSLSQSSVGASWYSPQRLAYGGGTRRRIRAEELGREAAAGGAVRGRFLELLGRVGVVHALETERTGQIALGHEPE